MRWIALALLFASAACKKHQDPPRPAPTVPVDGLTLVDPGAEPRSALRYHLAKGSSTPIELAMDVDVNTTQDGSGAAPGGSMPTLVIAMALGVDDVLPDGSAKIRSTVARAGARDRAGSRFSATQMEQQTALLEGVAITATLAPDGTIHDSQVEAGKAMPPTLAQQVSTLGQNLEQVSMPLPKEPVGVGAHWITHKVIDQGGVKLTADTTFELVAIDGDRVTYKSTATFAGAPQHVDQGGVTVDIQSAGGHSESHGTMDLARMVMTGEVVASFKTAMSVGGQASTLAVEMKTRVGPGEPAATAQGAQSAP